MLHHRTSLTSGSRELSMRRTSRPRQQCPARGACGPGGPGTGTDAVAHGAAGIRETMAGYIGLKPHMDVVVHHTTVSGDFALCRSQWRITGTDNDGKPIEIHHHGMEVMRRLPNGEWVFFIDHPWGADSSWAVDRPPHTE